MVRRKVLIGARLAAKAQVAPTWAAHGNGQLIRARHDWQLLGRPCRRSAAAEQRVDLGIQRTEEAEAVLAHDHAGARIFSVLHGYERELGEKAGACGHGSISHQSTATPRDIHDIRAVDEHRSRHLVRGTETWSSCWSESNC